MTLLIVLAALAVWRLSRLVTTDYLLDPLRNYISGFNPDDESEQRPRLGYLVTCPWCLSVWIAPIVLTAAIYWPTNRVVWIVLASLAASGITGMLSTIEDRLDR